MAKKIATTAKRKAIPAVKTKPKSSPKKKIVVTTAKKIAKPSSDATTPAIKKLETTPVAEVFTKNSILTYLSETSGTSKKQASMLLDSLGNLIGRHLNKRGAAGKFTLPGLLKIEIKNKPAVKARKGMNPFTGQMTTFKAKPARRSVKVKALKRLKEMAE